MKAGFPMDFFTDHRIHRCEFLTKLRGIFVFQVPTVVTNLPPEIRVKIKHRQDIRRVRRMQREAEYQVSQRFWSVSFQPLHAVSRVKTDFVGKFRANSKKFYTSMNCTQCVFLETKV